MLRNSRGRHSDNVYNYENCFQLTIAIKGKWRPAKSLFPVICGQLETVEISRAYANNAVDALFRGPNSLYVGQKLESRRPRVCWKAMRISDEMYFDADLCSVFTLWLILKEILLNAEP